jgi:hypothetical protein
MNGDSSDKMYQDAIRLTKAVRELEDAIRISFPNGRNYLHLDDPLGYDYRQDREKWSDMLRGLEEIKRTVDDYAETLAKQLP